MNRRIDKSTKNRDEETKQNTSLIDLSLQQIDSEARPQALLPLYSYLFWVASSSVATGSALSSYD